MNLHLMGMSPARPVLTATTGVGWGEPTANPNIAMRLKVPMLGFACGSPQPTPSPLDQAPASDFSIRRIKPSNARSLNQRRRNRIVRAPPPVA